MTHTSVRSRRKAVRTGRKLLTFASAHVGYRKVFAPACVHFTAYQAASRLLAQMWLKYMFRMNIAADHETALARAHLSLEGLSVGDAFGEQFFITPGLALAQILQRELPEPMWRWTDDTAMALAVVNTLAQHRGIDADSLASTFAQAYQRDCHRGYGPKAHQILRAIAEGTPWHVASTAVFEGGGSMGNGSAMRVPPVGAYFAHDLEAVVEHAARSAAPTHAHPEARAGAIAVALAAALAARVGAGASTLSGVELLHEVTRRTPPGDVHAGLLKACTLPLSSVPTSAAAELGNGARVLCSDTVPFALWCVARHLNDFEAAMWSTVSALGDRDTTCAIVGGVVALAVAREGIPEHFLSAREPLSWPIAPRART